MTPAQITLVRDTWEQVLPISDSAASLFYGKLFELDPELRKLFKADMQTQGRKLMAMIDTAVRGLGRVEILRPALLDLGRRHTGYGVRPDDYATVAVALLWALEQGLGEAFTSEVRQAWTEVYMILATTMQSG
ncbi:MAG: globin family protein [Pseudomonadota bacterium]|jgi:hemoglobin-like flavoprotein|nr:hemin receptor [Gammaproteobacteria bacterium]MEC9356724.1 globin family protein [Pseudomonadota bacterium]